MASSRRSLTYDGRATDRSNGSSGSRRGQQMLEAEGATWTIAVVFVADFVVELSIAPRKLSYLPTHWLTALSLALPAM